VIAIVVVKVNFAGDVVAPVVSGLILGAGRVTKKLPAVDPGWSLRVASRRKVSGRRSDERD